MPPPSTSAAAAPPPSSPTTLCRSSPPRDDDDDDGGDWRLVEEATSSAAVPDRPRARARPHRSRAFGGVRPAGYRRLAQRASVDKARRVVHGVVGVLVDRFVRTITREACLVSGEERRVLDADSVLYALKRRGRMVVR
jgi:hypothetical protein